MMKIEPVTLVGQLVRLEPLRQEQAAALYEASREDPDLWQYMPVRQPRSIEQMEQLVAKALQFQMQGTSLPFAIIDQTIERVIGETRYVNIMVQDRGLEIGATWLAPSVQRTGINTEGKYLLLNHAFSHRNGKLHVKFARVDGGLKAIHDEAFIRLMRQ